VPEGFDAYRVWLGISPRDQPPNQYRLLAVDLFESDPEVIRDAAQQRMAHVRNYQLGPNMELSQKILNELAAAKVCLLDPARKAAYDEELRTRLGTPAPPPAAAPVVDFEAMIGVTQDRPRALVMASRQRTWRTFAVMAAGGSLVALVVLVAVLYLASRPPSSATVATHQAEVDPKQPASLSNSGPDVSDIDGAASSERSGPSGKQQTATASSVQMSGEHKLGQPAEPEAAPQGLAGIVGKAGPSALTKPTPAFEASEPQAKHAGDLFTAGSRVQGTEPPGETTSADWPHVLQDAHLLSGMVFSVDGRFMLTAWNVGDRVQVRDGHTGRLIHALQARTDQATFSPDQRFLVTVGPNQAIQFWDPVAGNLLRSARVHSDRIQCVAVSPDGRLVATGANDMKVIITNAANAEPVQVLTGHQERVRGVAFSPDGRTLASGAMDATVKLWDTKSWRCRMTLGPHPGSVLCIAISPDGSRLAAGGPGGRVRVWDTAAGRLLFSPDGQKGNVSSVAYSADGKYLATANDGEGVKLWNSQDGKLVRDLGEEEVRVYAAAFSPDGKVLVASGKDRTIRCWNLSEILNAATAGRTTPSSMNGKQPMAASTEAALESRAASLVPSPNNSRAVLPKGTPEHVATTADAQTKPKRDVAGPDRSRPSIIRQGEELGLWLVAGPFGYESVDQAYDEVHPIEKAPIDITAKFGQGKTAVSWRPYEGIATVGRDTGANIVLAAGPPPPTARATVYYAACWVKFPQNMRNHEANHEAELTCKCPCKYWLNGKPLKGSLALHGTNVFLHPAKAEQNGWEEVLVKMVVPCPWTQKWAPLLRMSMKHRKDEFGRPMEGELPQVTIEQPTESGFLTAPTSVHSVRGGRPR